MTRRETDVLAWMIDHGGVFDDDDAVTPADRSRWREQLPATRAGRPCGCGTCPSIELTDAAGATPDLRHHRVVLQAGAVGALLLLFIDDDLLSYLELAPMDDEQTFSVFPPPEQIRMDG